ncbi:hypothetical protein GCM10018965_055930 [Nonomuraea roseola]
MGLRAAAAEERARGPDAAAADEHHQERGDAGDQPAPAALLGGRLLRRAPALGALLPGRGLLHGLLTVGERLLLLVLLLPVLRLLLLPVLRLLPVGGLLRLSIGGLLLAVALLLAVLRLLRLLWLLVRLLLVVGLLLVLLLPVLRLLGWVRLLVRLTALRRGLVLIPTVGRGPLRVLAARGEIRRHHSTHKVDLLTTEKLVHVTRALVAKH